MSVLFPSEIDGHPCSCGGEGVPNVLVNQDRTTGWNRSMICCAMETNVSKKEL